MAERLTPTELRNALRKWNVPAVYQPGWETRSNNSGWGTGKQVTGCMYHHTATDASDAVNLRLITYGRSDLSGPLANFGVRDTGVIDVVAAGSANHAGGGDPDTLRMVQQEKTPLDRDVKPDQNSSSAGSVGGNNKFYGWESYYGIGKDPTPNPLQHRVTVLSMTAIIDALDAKDGSPTWTGRAAIGHREWTNRKIDPSAVKMYEVRKDINMLLKAGPAAALVWYKTGSLPSTPSKPEVPPVATVSPVYRGTAPGPDVVKSLMASDVFAAPDRSTTNPYWSGSSWFKYVGYYTRDSLIGVQALNQKVDDLTTHIADLQALVQRLVDNHAPEAPQ